MKRHAVCTVLLLVLSLPAITSADGIGDDFPQDDIHQGEETIVVEDLFIPKGFDANDQIEIIATGWKPSPCYSTPTAIVERSGNDVNIRVKSTKIVGRDRLCIDMAVQYMISIPVPAVPAGRYSVIANKDTDQPRLSHMDIAPPTHNSIDDFLYANVEQVSVNSKTRVVTLRGENPSPCIVLDNILYTSNDVNTYALMPVMRKKDAVCPSILTPFEYKYTLPNDLTAPKILVHVRTLEGNSKNKVFVSGH